MNPSRVIFEKNIKNLQGNGIYSINRKMERQNQQIRERQISRQRKINKKKIEEELQEYLSYQLKKRRQQKLSEDKYFQSNFIKQRKQKITKKKRKRHKAQMEQQKQKCIIVGYHYPCVDGVFSAMNCFLSLKLYNAFNTDLMDRLITQDFENDYFNFEEMQKSSNESSENKNKKLEEGEEEQKQSDTKKEDVQNEIKKLKDRLELHSEDLKGYLYSDSFKAMKFVACKIMQSADEQIDIFLKFKHIDIENSVVILLDYYGQTASNLKRLCEKYKRVIILDHHITLVSTLTEIIDEFKEKEVKTETIDLVSETKVEEQQKEEPEKEEKKEEESKEISNFLPNSLTSGIKKIFPNLQIIYNRRKSGATLTYDFFCKLFKFESYLNEKVFQQVTEISKLVEIYDTKFEKSRRAESFVANLLNNSYEFNAKKNYIIFTQLLNCYIEGHVKLGERIIDNIEKQANNLAKQKFIVHIGGKNNTIAKCYAVMSTNYSIINQTAHKLAEMSLRDGMDNVGCFIINEKSKNSIKVSLRCDNDPNKEQKCHLIAKHFNGGGHPSASSFFTTFSSVRSWR